MLRYFILLIIYQCIGILSKQLALLLSSLRGTFKNMIQRLSRLTLILALSICLGCMPIDYEGNLTNGYRVFKSNSLSISITSSDGSAIISEEYITRINVKGGFIFGRIDPLKPELQRLVINKRHPGYFIVNTKNRSYRLGLEKQEWLNELKKVGIDKEPVLWRPSSFRNELAPITALRAIIFGQR